MCFCKYVYVLWTFEAQAQSPCSGKTLSDLNGNFAFTDCRTGLLICVCMYSVYVPGYGYLLFVYVHILSLILQPIVR